MADEKNVWARVLTERHVGRRIVSRALATFTVVDWPARLWALLRTFRWRLAGRPDLALVKTAPLMAWMNYHQSEIVGKRCHWFGHRALKNPLDAWVYQEIICETRPDFIVEIGNKNGGSTLFLAHMCDLLGHGTVLALDIDHAAFGVTHPRIVTITGDCSDESVLAQVHVKVAGRKVLVIHDADHSREAVLRDLRLYAPIVSSGSYFIVEDTIHGVSGFSISQDVRPGVFTVSNLNSPLSAVEAFLEGNREFVLDRDRERYILTSNYRGFLRRVRPVSAPPLRDASCPPVCLAVSVSLRAPRRPNCVGRYEGSRHGGNRLLRPGDRQ